MSWHIILSIPSKDTFKFTLGFILILYLKIECSAEIIMNLFGVSCTCPGLWVIFTCLPVISIPSTCKFAILFFVLAPQNFLEGAPFKYPSKIVRTGSDTSLTIYVSSKVVWALQLRCIEVGRSHVGLNFWVSLESLFQYFYNC